jgi:hypothetical protein
LVAMLNHCMVRKTPYAAIPRFRRENSVLMHISRNVMQYDVWLQISATSASLSTEKLDLNICRQDFLQLENEVVFNEAVIEEREQGIQEIHQQIGEVNEIFKDLAVLVNEQGYMIDDIESHIESANAATVQGNRQLVKAVKSQKSGSSITCWILVIVSVALLLFIVFMVL